MGTIISIAVLLIILGSTLVAAQQNEPDIKSLSEIICPDDKPFKCVPEGQCCRYDQYCSSNSKSCESCFHNRKEDEDIRQYCLGDGRHELKGQCQFACRYRQGQELDAALIQNFSRQEKAVNETDVGNNQDYVTYILTVIFAIILFVLLLLMVYAYRKECYRICSQERLKDKPHNGETCPLTAVKVDTTNETRTALVSDSSESIGIHRRDAPTVTQLEPGQSPGADLEVNQSRVESQTLLGKSTSGQGAHSPDSGWESIGSNHPINQLVVEREQTKQRAWHINETTGEAEQGKLVTNVSRHCFNETSGGALV
ncbi:hypothetical protein Btru_055184 [Bulinus truncatus]|nr:hypothetical protein Btru_055184 [Bulinus truncatus]